MPCAPTEAAPSPLASIERTTEKGLAESLIWLTNKMPDGASGPTWSNSLREWAAPKLQGISESLEATRNRDLTRLMNLLRNDPDEGLRFALPMGGGENHRIAPPPSVLGSHNVDFRLGNLGGGGANGVWWGVSARPRAVGPGLIWTTAAATR